MVSCLKLALEATASEPGQPENLQLGSVKEGVDSTLNDNSL